MMIVLTFGMSMPDSMMVVQTSTSKSWRTKPRMTSSRTSSSIWPWPMPKRASGTSSRRWLGEASIEWTRLWTTVDLPAAVDFAQDDLADQRVAVIGDEGADRQAFLRRRVDDADVANTGQGHVQRARDRRGAHRQDIDFGPQSLEELLVPHAEALLLVDDDQSEILKSDVVLYQAMRADHDVDFAVWPGRW